MILLCFFEPVIVCLCVLRKRSVGLWSLAFRTMGWRFCYDSEVSCSGKILCWHRQPLVEYSAAPSSGGFHAEALDFLSNHDGCPKNHRCSTKTEISPLISSLICPILLVVSLYMMSTLDVWTPWSINRLPLPGCGTTYHPKLVAWCPRKRPTICHYISPWHPNFGRFDMVKFQFWLILYQHLAGVVCFGWFLHPMVVACCCLNHHFIWWSPRYIHDHDPHIFPDQTGIYPGIKDLIGGVLRGLSQDPKRGLGGFLIREVLGVSLTCPTMFLLSHCCKWACFQNGVYYSTPHFASRTRQSRLSQWFAMPET